MTVSVEKQNSLLNSKYLYNCFVADFETITANTNYFKEHNKTDIVYGIIKKFDDTLMCSFNKIEDMFDDLIAALPTYNKFKIFFHNLSFDGVFILDWLGRNGFQWRDIPKEDKTFTLFRTTGSKIYSIKAVYKNKVFEFRCSKMLLSASVKDLGKSVNISKYVSEAQETEEFYNVEPIEDLLEFEAVNRDYCLYCERDVEIVRLSLLSFYSSLYTFLTDFNAGEEWYKKVMDGATISQISLQLQLMCAAAKGITPDQLHFTKEEDRVIMDKFTNGGLTIPNEAYRHTLLTDLNGYVIDLKSAYPAVMSDLLPYGPVLHHRPVGDNYCEFVEVFYESLTPKNHKIPLLKNWTKKKPNEPNYFLEAYNYKTYLLTDEMELLEQLYDFTGKKIIKSYYFTLASYLTKFIDYGFKMKEKYKAEGNLASSHTFKILLNSAYGIHAKRTDFKLVKGWKGKEWCDKKKTYSLSEHINLNAFDTHSYIPNVKLYAYDFTGFISDDLFISTHKGIANYITAKTRCKILKGIIHFKPENFLYCDTDSLFLMNIPVEDILKYCGNKLGDWELETGKEFDSAVVMRSKTYQLYKDGQPIKSGTAGIRKNVLDLKDTLNQQAITVANATLIPQRVEGGIILVPVDKILTFDKELNLTYDGEALDNFINIVEKVRNNG